MSEQKIEQFWRDATAEDVLELTKDGKPVAARFRDGNDEDWHDDLLAGLRLSRYFSGIKWLDFDEVTWDQCQVYDPPQWFINKPDPGEGYRLLEKFPPEELRSGFDDVYDVESQSWLGVATISSEQKETVWYRRRIEPVKPDPGEGYRLLEKDPPEPLQIGDEVLLNDTNTWIVSSRPRLGNSNQNAKNWYRRRIETIAQCPEPAPSIDNNVSVLCEVKLPVSCSVLGAIIESLSKEYPGSTMRQVGGHLRFERRVDQWHEES